jgi:hypothetical protein
MQYGESTSAGYDTSEPQVPEYQEQNPISGVVPATPEQIKAYRDAQYKKRAIFMTIIGVLFAIFPLIFTPKDQFGEFNGFIIFGVVVGLLVIAGGWFSYFKMVKTPYIHGTPVYPVADGAYMYNPNQNVYIVNSSV